MACSRCGDCCKSEVCRIGVDIYKTNETPCPGLKRDGTQYACELVDIVPEEQRAFFYFLMGVGRGCCNSDKVGFFAPAGNY
jgi:hypothetical protein